MVKMKRARLITWEWFGEHAAVEQKIVVPRPVPPKI